MMQNGRIMVQLSSISSKALLLISSGTQSRICDPCTSFLKDTFYDNVLGSSVAKSDLIDHGHEKGSHYGSCKVKQPICDIKERAMDMCSSKWKDPIHDK